MTFFQFFFLFGWPGGGPGSVLSEFGAGFSAKAGTLDFERQHSVLDEFSRFRGG